MAVFAVSSATAASAVGLGIITPALHALGLEVVAAPTVTLGRHPGWGAPGGAGVPDTVFASLLEGAAAHPAAAAARWALTGYFASAAQVEAAAALIVRLKAARPGLRYVCDPVMGDAPKGLYVREEAAVALAARLVPLADMLTPNAWEAARLTGRPVTDAAGARAAAAALREGAPHRLVAVTSTPVDTTGEESGPRLGVTLAAPEGVWLASAPLRGRDAATPPAHGRGGDLTAWGGTGDLFGALFLAALDSGAAAPDALGRALGGLDAVLKASQGRPELVRAGLAATLSAAPPAAVTRLA